MFRSLRQQVEAQGATLEVLGVGTTGYAKDVLKETLHADVALVETVAHTESAMRFYDDPHCIVDVGGQDIKLIVLKDGRVKDFKLNTQCSAGNGYFLQSTAESLGIKVEEYSDIAFSANQMPIFGYGCAVFMQSDIVNFQRQGWAAKEILAGLAAVLPKNIFLYVEEHLPLRREHSQSGKARETLHPARWHAKEPGSGKGRSRFREVALPQRTGRSRSDRPRALRRIGCNRRRGGSDAHLQEWPREYLHWPRRGAEHQLSHHPQ
ncbi:MAG: hypothetical protein DMG61_20275 [Acidobacteria bacterium]|nr:MAG: hypothetical protein DMG61_20275 [Acidobacteriota bacterium]